MIAGKGNEIQVIGVSGKLLNEFFRPESEIGSLAGRYDDVSVLRETPVVTAVQVQNADDFLACRRSNRRLIVQHPVKSFERDPGFLCQLPI